MIRGRLIFALLAELHRVDPEGTPYDPDFDEPIGPGRGELPPVRVRCQVEPRLLEEVQMRLAGNAPRSRLQLVFHFRDLEVLGLVEPSTGEAAIRPGDRLGALYDLGGRLVQTIRTPPGLYVTEARPIGFGLGRMPRRNLLLVTFEARAQAPRRSG